MSKNQKKNRSSFKYTPTQSIPPLTTYKTEWDLRKLYYTSDKDPRIEADLAAAEADYAAFAKKYCSKEFTSTPESLLPALADYERLAASATASKAARYFSFRSELDVSDAVAEKRSLVINDRLKKATNQILFFELEIGKIPVAKQKKFLTHKALKPYRYYLERVFLEAQHNLTEPEEKIIRLAAQPAYGLWVAATEKLIGKSTVVYKKQTLSLNEAIEMIDTLPPAEKPTLWSLIMEKMEGLGEFAENEFTAVLTDAKTDDYLRGYQKPYSGTAIGYEDEESSIEALVAAVSHEGFKISRDFYRHKAVLHNLSELPYARKYDTIGTTKDIPFETAVEICRDVFYGLKHEYGAIFDTMLQNGQIDVYPKKGKRGGAFMSNAVNLPTQVMLNHTSTFKALETLAHEMGHAIHGERSKTQPVFYQGHSTTTAETASTLFENLVFDAVFKQATEDEQVVMLHDRITRDIATIQRQIAFFNAELEMHTKVRTEGAITNAELRDIMTKHLRSYLGTGVAVLPQDGYSYVYVSHFRYGFYVYTYAFGLMMSTILANRYKDNPEYIDDIDRFLCSGKTDTVANIFSQVDIDVTNPAVFSDALKAQKQLVAEFKLRTSS